MNAAGLKLAETEANSRKRDNRATDTDQGSGVLF